jgi:ABC-2 type transport system permease protein
MVEEVGHLGQAFAGRSVAAEEVRAFGSGLGPLPGWVQWIGQLTPIYWMGLGMRSALLPDSAVVVELGDSWRHLEMAAVLGAWAVGGLLLAPVVLRRMARRESGSKVAERRDRALRRVA